MIVGQEAVNKWKDYAETEQISQVCWDLVQVEELDVWFGGNTRDCILVMITHIYVIVLGFQ